MHDFELSRLADAVNVQARGLKQVFHSWLLPTLPDATERVIHIQLFRELEEAVRTIQTEMEGKRQRH